MTAALSIQAMLYLERTYEGFVSWLRVFRLMCLALGIAFLLQAVFAVVHLSAEMPRWSMIAARESRSSPFRCGDWSLRRCLAK